MRHKSYIVTRSYKNGVSSIKIDDNIDCTSHLKSKHCDQYSHCESGSDDGHGYCIYKDPALNRRNSSLFGFLKKENTGAAKYPLAIKIVNSEKVPLKESDYGFTTKWMGKDKGKVKLKNDFLIDFKDAINKNCYDFDEKYCPKKTNEGTCFKKKGDINLCLNQTYLTNNKLIIDNFINKVTETKLSELIINDYTADDILLHLNSIETEKTKEQIKKIKKHLIINLITMSHEYKSDNWDKHSKTSSDYIEKFLTVNKYNIKLDTETLESIYDEAQVYIRDKILNMWGVHALYNKNLRNFKVFIENNQFVDSTNSSSVEVVKEKKSSSEKSLFGKMAEKFKKCEGKLEVDCSNDNDCIFNNENGKCRKKDKCEDYDKAKCPNKCIVNTDEDKCITIPGNIECEKIDKKYCERVKKCTYYESRCIEKDVVKIKEDLARAEVAKEKKQANATATEKKEKNKTKDKYEEYKQLMSKLSAGDSKFTHKETLKHFLNKFKECPENEYEFDCNHKLHCKYDDNEQKCKFKTCTDYNKSDCPTVNKKKLFGKDIPAKCKIDSQKCVNNDTQNAKTTETTENAVIQAFDEKILNLITDNDILNTDISHIKLKDGKLSIGKQKLSDQSFTNDEFKELIDILKGMQECKYLDGNVGVCGQNKKCKYVEQKCIKKDCNDYNNDETECKSNKCKFYNVDNQIKCIANPEFKTTGKIFGKKGVQLVNDDVISEDEALNKDCKDFSIKFCPKETFKDKCFGYKDKCRTRDEAKNLIDNEYKDYVKRYSGEKQEKTSSFKLKPPINENSTHSTEWPTLTEENKASVDAAKQRLINTRNHEEVFRNEKKKNKTKSVISK